MPSFLFRALAPVAAILVLWSPAIADPTYAPGSRIGFELAPGFVASARFAGFEDPMTATSVLVTELPAESYAHLVSSDDQAFAARGLALDERRPIDFAGGEALILSGIQDANGTPYRKWILLVGAADMTGLVTVQVPKLNAGAVYGAIDAMLETVAVRPPLQVSERLAALPFRLNVIEPLRVANVIGGSAATLTRGPNDVAKGVEQPLLIVARSLVPVPPGVSAKEMSHAALTALEGVADARIIDEQPVTIAGGEGYEILAEARHSDTGEPIAVVQWFRPLADSYLRLVGMTAPASWETDLKAFQAVRDGIEVD